MILAIFAMTTMPWGWRSRERLQHLSAIDVREISMSQTSDSSEYVPTVMLNPGEIKEFLTLMNQTRRHAPNHPYGGWTVFVRIDVVADDDYYFGLHSTTNTGTYISLYSNGLDGWNYGELRNDGMKEYVERVFKVREITLRTL